MFRARRDARAWERLAAMRGRVAQMPAVQLLYVTGVYQRARRGSKALVRTEDGSTWDAWFWHYHAQPGSAVAVAVQPGWGPHNAGDVLYVGSERAAGVYEVLDAKSLRRCHRHYRCLLRATARVD
jgi:hypothetical protein